MPENPYGIDAFLSQGDWVIRGVAVVLLAMSIASWFVIVTRCWALLRLRPSRRAAGEVWHTQSFDEGLERLGEGPFRHLAQQARSAVERHAQHEAGPQSYLPLADWLAASLRVAMDEIMQQLQSGLAVLASVGATAPFVGLFGTVWGIYRALVGIGVSGQVGIDRVAGPVGEALIMTAFGLAVAIPAVLGYNALARANRHLRSQLDGFAHQLHAYFLMGTPPSAASLKVIGGGR